MVALRAEMTCTLEGKDRLCPRLLLVAAHPLLRVGGLEGEQSRGRVDLRGTGHRCLLKSSHVHGWDQAQEPSVFLSLAYTKPAPAEGTLQQETLSCWRGEDDIRSSWGSSSQSEHG